MRVHIVRTLPSHRTIAHAARPGDQRQAGPTLPGPAAAGRVKKNGQGFVAVARECRHSPSAGAASGRPTLRFRLHSFEIEAVCSRGRPLPARSAACVRISPRALGAPPARNGCASSFSTPLHTAHRRGGEPEPDCSLAEIAKALVTHLASLLLARMVCSNSVAMQSGRRHDSRPRGEALAHQFGAKFCVQARRTPPRGRNYQRPSAVFALQNVTSGNRLSLSRTAARSVRGRLLAFALVAARERLVGAQRKLAVDPDGTSFMGRLDQAIHPPGPLDFRVCWQRVA